MISGSFSLFKLLQSLEISGLLLGITTKFSEKKDNTKALQFW